MNRHYINLFRFFFAITDLLCLNLIQLFVLFLIRQYPETNQKAYTIFFMVSNLVWLCSAYINAIYIKDKHISFEKFSKRTAQSFLMYLFLVFFFIFLFQFSYSRTFVMISSTGFGISLLISRTLFFFGTGYFYSNGRNSRKVIILGYNDLSKKLVDYFTISKYRISVEGYFEENENVHELSQFPILGKLKESVPYAINNQVKEIYSTVSPEQNADIYELAQVAENNLIRFRFVPDFQRFVNRNTYIDFVEDIPVLSLRSEPLEDLAGRMNKRIFDIALSLVVIIFILSWLVPLLALIIKLNSPGPVFFVQLRSGKNNRSFRCLKFRTLNVNPDSDSRQVTRDDARITKLGRFLRKTNLDELPQFINVLLADMSVVGPRPHMLKHTEEYSRNLNHYMIRHFVKPGVTGWAQVNGYRGEISKVEQLRQRIEHDIWYMEHWSIWLDIRIVLQTIFLSVKGDKNAF